MEGNQPIVIDNGSGMIKAGFAGADKPRVLFRSLIAKPKHPKLMSGGALEGVEVLVGNKIDEHRGILALHYPIEHGIVQSWSEMEKLWSFIYTRDNLNVPSEDHAVLFTEAPLNPIANREKAAEIFFENFNVPALFCSMQAILSLYASGRTTGTVLDSGDGVTHIVPVYEGFALPHGIIRMDLGGRDVTQYLQLLLRRGGYNFNTSAELEIVRTVKEACCEVSLDPINQENWASDTSKNLNKATYTLPDGSLLLMSNETFRAPEILFQPELIGYETRGIHDSIVNAIMRSDMDLRAKLFGQIVLSGGSTLFKGFGERLLNEVRKHKMCPKGSKIRIVAPPERLYTTWIGGSILASLGTFQTMWITRADYIEHGAGRLHVSKHQL
jgi:centractin